MKNRFAHAANDTPLFDLVQGTAPIIITAPHNGHLVPESLYHAGDPLGVPARWFDPAHPDKRHEACDWGAQELYETLKTNLADTGCSFLGAHYSRLVCDLNRPPHLWLTATTDEFKIPIPANQNVSEHVRQHRQDTFYSPWFNAMEGLITTAKDHNNGRALLLDIHSFTPTWHSEPRTLDIGTLRLKPSPVSDLMDSFFQAANDSGTITFRPDAPYNLQTPEVYNKLAAKTLCEKYNIAYYGLEVKNTLLQNPHGLKAISTLITDAVKQKLLPQIHHVLAKTLP